MDTLEIKQREEGGIIVLDIDGEVNLYNSPQLKETFNALLAENKIKILINLEKVIHIDSSGVGAIISLLSNLNKGSGVLKIINPNKAIRQVFNISKLHEFVEILEKMAQCNNSPIIIFGHSLYISAMVSYLGSSKRVMPTKKELTFRFPNCCISSFECSQGAAKWKILNVASIAHLPVDIVTGTECLYGNPIK